MDSDLVTTSGVMGSLSIASSLVILITYAAYPKLRTDWRRLLVCLSICDAMQGIFYCTWHLVPSELSFRCIGFSMFGLFSANAAYLWTACIAHQLQRRMIFMLDGNEQFAGQDQWFRFYHTLCWGYPTLIVVTCLGSEVYYLCTNPDCFGCFLQPKPAWWRIFGLYFTLWSCWIFTLVMYVRTYFNFRNLVKGVEITPRMGELIRAFKLKLFLVPLIFIVLRLPETLYRLREILSGDPEAVESDGFGTLLNHLQAVFNPSQGLTNFILFIVATPAVIKTCQRCLCGPKWCSSYEEETTSLLDPVTRPKFPPGITDKHSISREGAPSKSFHDLSPAGDVFHYSRDSED